jgi:hypothetical protein
MYRHVIWACCSRENQARKERLISISPSLFRRTPAEVRGAISRYKGAALRTFYMSLKSSSDCCGSGSDNLVRGPIAAFFQVLSSLRDKAKIEMNIRMES